MEKAECETCGGQGATIINEWCDQYDRAHLQWDVCRVCGGNGWVEIEEDDE